MQKCLNFFGEEKKNSYLDMLNDVSYLIKNVPLKFFLSFSYLVTEMDSIICDELCNKECNFREK